MIIRLCNIFEYVICEFLIESTHKQSLRAIYSPQFSITFVKRLCGHSYEYTTTDINLYFIFTAREVITTKPCLVNSGKQTSSVRMSVKSKAKCNLHQRIMAMMSQTV